MNRALRFFLCLFMGTTLVLALEVVAVRGDQRAMMYAYGSFLAKRVGGAPLSSRIKAGSLAVFKMNSGAVACGMMN